MGNNNSTQQATQQQTEGLETEHATEGPSQLPTEHGHVDVGMYDGPNNYMQPNWNCAQQPTTEHLNREHTPHDHTTTTRMTPGAPAGGVVTAPPWTHGASQAI